MREQIFNVEAVSPMMLGNAEAQPELRPPAVRASARFWLRAVAGAVIGDTDTENIFKLESAVFGDTKTGSPISIRIPFPDPEKIPYTEYILPHKNAGPRKAFHSGEKFKIILSSRNATQATWNAAMVAMEMAITFGGLGLRSRRGYGTLKIVGSSGDTTIQKTPQTLEGWQAYISGLITRAVSAVQALAGVMPPTTPPAGPCTFPCGNQKSIIRIGQGTDTTAMDAIIRFMGKVPKKIYLGGITPRQASPLWVRPIQTGNDEFRLLFITLPSDFSGNDYPALKTDFLNKEHPSLGSDILVKGWNL